MTSKTDVPEDRFINQPKEVDHESHTNASIEPSDSDHCGGIVLREEGGLFIPSSIAKPVTHTHVVETGEFKPSLLLVKKQRRAAVPKGFKSAEDLEIEKSRPKGKPPAIKKRPSKKQLEQLIQNNKGSKKSAQNAQMLSNAKKRKTSGRLRKAAPPNFKSKEDPIWAEAQRAKYLKRYHSSEKRSPEEGRLMRDRYRKKYPEKYAALKKTANIKAKTKGNNLHHWSYNEEHYKGVIELTVKDHNKAHRFMKYD